LHISLFLVPAIWLLKSVAYVILFRVRSIKATYLNCLIIAGGPLLLGFVPIPLPGFMSVPLVIGLAVYLTMHYTGVSLIPDGLFIPLGVEAFFRIALWAIQELTSAT
jgi:hypothetical protein